MTTTTTKVKSQATPMIKQYLEIKEKYPDYLLLYRMGDFYELFFKDATLASESLSIALTSRGNLNNKPIEMCGFPHHSSSVYIQKLIAKGFKLAICEQAEKPTAGNKLLKREVVRLITKGTIIEEELLDARSNNFLLVVYFNRNLKNINNNKDVTLAYCDISTGELFFETCHNHNLISNIIKINPSEILISDDDSITANISTELTSSNIVITKLANVIFNPTAAKRAISNHYQIEYQEILDKKTESEIISIGVLLDYINLTQITNKLKLLIPKKIDNKKFLAIDSSSRRGLEINLSSYKQKKESLLNTIDKTKTSKGARLLYTYINQPLLDEVEINRRFDIIDFFIKNQSSINTIREYLSHSPDIERSFGRLEMNYSYPKDLKSIQIGLETFVQLNDFLLESEAVRSKRKEEVEGQVSKESITELLDFNLDSEKIYDILDTLTDALVDSPPNLIGNTDYIKSTHSEVLAEARLKSLELKRMMVVLENEYRQTTKIDKLHIKSNNLIGYYIEVPSKQASLVPSDFLHRHTTQQTLRFSTPKLQELVISLDSCLKLTKITEEEIFHDLSKALVANKANIQKASKAIAKLDVFCSLALIAIENNFTRPKFDNATGYNIESSRHPVVENFLSKDATDFIPNDIIIPKDKSIMILTGANMTGKSTYLRQVAIMSILAQMGSFLPARKATLPIIDSIMTRIGAQDEIAKGKSTFMVEMLETSRIIHEADKNSLVILDELGRGTSTFDGLAIAWSCLEYLASKTTPYTLFATHFLELIELKNSFNNILDMQMAVIEDDNQIIFKHKIIPGTSKGSYGINVAQMAGIPIEIITRAKDILVGLEKNKQKTEIANTVNEKNNFNQAEDKIQKKLVEKLINIDVNNISPREALDYLYELCKSVSNENQNN